MNLHTLTKIRRASKHGDGAEGIVYVHQWPSGFQELIFENEKIAEEFLKTLNSADKPKADVTTMGETATRLVDIVTHSGSNAHAGEA
jgi:hypothetical protein